MIYPQTLSFLRLVTSKFPSSSKKKKTLKTLPMKNENVFRKEKISKLLMGFVLVVLILYVSELPKRYKWPLEFKLPQGKDFVASSLLYTLLGEC